MRWVETRISKNGAQGRGWSVKSKIGPAVPAQSPLQRVARRPHGLLGANSFVGTVRNMDTLDTRIVKVAVKALGQARYDFDMPGIVMAGFRGILQQVFRQHLRPTEDQCKMAATIAKEAEKNMLTSEQDSYKKWIESACEGGVQGLYKAKKARKRTC